MWFSTDTTEINDEQVLTARSSAGPESLWFDGHFPDDPILPGIAQLDMVLKVITEAVARDLVLHSLSRIKFKKVIRPGDSLSIQVVAAKKEYHYSFTIEHEQQAVCSGRMALTPKKEQDPTMATEITQTITRIAAIIIDELKLEDVTPETFDADLDLVDEVGIDSMDLATIALVLRDEYGIRIDEDDYPKLTTVRIIAEYISTKLAEKE